MPLAVFFVYHSNYRGGQNNWVEKVGQNNWVDKIGQNNWVDAVVPRGKLPKTHDCENRHSFTRPEIWPNPPLFLLNFAILQKRVATTNPLGIRRTIEGKGAKIPEARRKEKVSLAITK